MYSHSKRMLPRKDEQPFRTEFPSHYYSSSSVYSYTPTSSSDCPEHGRSHRRTTLILTISVIFATLGVLSIAGVAAYLGILSKGNNNASQTEESFMLLNSNSKSVSDDESEIYYGNGRSSHRDPIGDLTNTLLETKLENPAVPSFEDVDLDLNQKHHPHHPPPPPTPTNKVRFSQRNSTSVVTSKTSKVNPQIHQFNFEEQSVPPGHNDNNHDPREQGVVVKTSTSTTVVTSQQSQSQQQQQYPVRYSSFPGSSSPSSNHHQRYPPTNSHYGLHADNEDQPSPFLTHFDSESKHTGNPVVTTSGVINFHDFQDHPTNNHTKIISHNKNATGESKVTRKEDHQQYKDKSSSMTQQQDDITENGQGLAGSSSNYEDIKKLTPSNKYGGGIQSVSKNNKNESYRGTSTTVATSTTQGPPTYYYFSTTSKPNRRTPLPVLSQVHGTNIPSDQFVPAKPFFKTKAATLPTVPTLDEGNGDLLANHRVHLTFDRIAPEFYDQNPWTPLVVRPNLDKKPRVEAETTPGPGVPAQSKEMYYRYGDTASNVNINFFEPSLGPGNVKSSSPESDKGEGVNNGAFRHTVMESDHHSHSLTTGGGVGAVINSNDDDKELNTHNMTIIVSTSTNVTEEDDGIKSPPSLSTNLPAQNEEPWDDVVQQPVPIPAFTVLIPHIPNPKPKPEHNENENQVLVNPNLSGNTGDDESHDFDVDKFRNGEIGQFLTGISAAERDKESQRDAEEFDRNTSVKADEVDDEETIGELVRSDSKDEDYSDNEDLIVETSPQTKIYRLDSVNLDSPQNIGNQNQPSEMNNNVSPGSSNNSSEESPIKGPIEPDLQIRTTTDFILSTLGSLNLVKPFPTRSQGQDQKNSDNEEDAKTEPPLFPPIRSYVGINQPLRPKPSESEESGEASIILLSEPNFLSEGDPHRKLRTETGADGIPHLTPDLATTTSFNKVLSMMMKFDVENNSNRTAENITAHNVHLVVAHANYSAPIAAYLNDTQNRDREQKSIHRDAKIDSRFRDFTEQIPVTLISADGSSIPSPSSFRPSKSSNGTGKWNPNKLSSITVTNSNSPVYKFVLRKGQSVEELLKEIFHNYTNKGIGNLTNGIKGNLPPSANIITTRPEVPGASPGSVDIQFTPLTKTTSTTKLPAPTPTPTSASTEASPLPTTTPEGFTDTEVINTSTSIVLSENETEDCSANSSFRCTSTGTCISNFAKCNGIKDCPDNSDEKNCLCVDFLKSQMLHRKICDGVPDCKDFSDEYQCEWCQPGQYICAASRACIPREKICDGKRDCPRGDDEGDCVKIGHTGEVDELEDISPTYHRSGHLMVRKKGVWGKLCVETFSTVLSHWEVKDLARAVCKAKTFSDFESVERVEDEDFSTTEPYYELFDGINQNDSAEANYPSSDTAPRSSIGFKLSPCKTKVVVKVTCQDLQCGTAPRAFTQAARIVGGSNALAGEWPWQAALYRDGEYQCGATLISSRWLLSAGHCFFHSQDDHWVARLGTLRRGATILSPYEQVIRITNIFLHPQYKDVGFINDVSLLRLEKEVNFTDFVRPVCLPGRDTQVRDGRLCTVVGWGQLFEVGRVFPDTLQEVQLPLISTTECRKRTLFLPLYKLTEEMFCAGFDRGGRDACLGDSGGPLMCPENDGRWSLYGVTSNGYGCARANRPGVYTKVASYLDWIYDKMSKHDSVSYRDKAKPCRGHRCPLGECLSEKRICNGVADCFEDASDERNCTWS